MKKFFTAALVVTMFLTACSVQPAPQKSETFKITSSLYPLAFIAETLAKDRAEVELLVPAGGEPHDFEPTPGQIVNLLNSNLVLTVGTNMEPWLEDLREELVQREVALLVMNDHVKTPLLPSVKHDAAHEEENHEDEDSHDEAHEEAHDEHGEWDPHTWTDPVIMMEWVTQVADALETLDPNGASLYQARADYLNAELRALDQDTRNKLKSCEQDSILVSHDAFAYMAQRYGLKTLSATGISPDIEPSAIELVEIVEAAKAQNIRFILMETLASPDVAEVLAKEVGLTPLELNPLEGLTPQEILNGENYLSISRKNSDNLAIALQCTLQ